MARLRRGGLPMFCADDGQAICQDLYRRLAAEFDNFEKRARREQRDVRKHAAAEVAARRRPCWTTVRWSRCPNATPNCRKERWCRSSDADTGPTTGCCGPRW